ncbi:MAG: FkbM family methyltransferase [Bacteroidales bacterium]
MEKTEIKENILKSSAALWCEKGPRPFYIYKGFKSSGSSLFQANIEYVNEHYSELMEKGPQMLAKTWYERAELIRETVIECETLDNVLENLSVTYKFDFLKIDAQGAEYEILRGAEKFLREDCQGLQLELFSIPLYKGIKLRSEVEALLSEFDFKLVKTFKAHGTFNSQNDCVFLKDKSHPNMDEKRRVLARIYEL